MQPQESSQQETEAPAQELDQDQEAPSQDQDQSAPVDQEAASPEAEEGADKEASEEGEKTEEVKPEIKPETPEAKHKRKGGYERKIEKLERQNQELIAALTARNGAAPTTETKKELTPGEKAADEFRALVKKAASEEVAAIRAQEQQQTRQAEFQKRFNEAKAAHPDFDDALEDVADIPVPNALNHVLLTSDKGPEIMYQLAKNPAELARISALPPLDAAREIGRLEAKFASGAAPQRPNSATRPPAPPSKVNGSSASSTRRLEDLPISEYKRAVRSGRR